MDLNTNITAEMTVTSHVALYQFTFNRWKGPSTASRATANASFFPESAPINWGEPSIMLSLMDLAKTCSGRGEINMSLKEDGSGAVVTGRGWYRPSFGTGNFYVGCKCARGPFSFAILSHHLLGELCILLGCGTCAFGGKLTGGLWRQVGSRRSLCG